MLRLAALLLLLSACRAARAPELSEVSRLCAEDQADREPPAGQAIDWEAVGPRDAARLARVKELYRAGALATGQDFHDAALVLQHGTEPEDYLLAHELCVIAVAKGETDALWLCAASEDRFLMNVGRPQRFATQYRSSGTGQPMALYEVGDGVTDELRAAFRCPTLQRARDREAEINARFPKSP
jgi:hypothetical protein